jgi:hypothetical protein
MGVCFPQYGKDVKGFFCMMISLIASKLHATPIREEQSHAQRRWLAGNIWR